MEDCAPAPTALTLSTAYEAPAALDSQKPGIFDGRQQGHVGNDGEPVPPVQYHHIKISLYPR